MAGIFLNRREFISKVLTGAGLTIGVSLGPPLLRAWAQEEEETEPRRNEIEIFSPSAFIQVTSDNIVTVVVNKSEMGQGITTAFPMIVAEEMDADWQQIRFEIAPAAERYADPVWGIQATGGSTSVRNMQEPLRRAASVARVMLVQAAAATWKVAANACETQKGAVRHTSSGRVLTYGQVCRRAARLPLPKNAVLLEKIQRRFVGKPMLRLDLPSKIDGSAVFGTDVFVENMAYAAVVRPPAFGAKAVSWEKDAGQKISGILAVLELDRGIAICAESVAALQNGVRAINIKWDKGSHPGLNTASLERTLHLRLKPSTVTVGAAGGRRGAATGAQKRVKEVYSVPYLAHATMEPMNCTAHVRQDGCSIWVSTQNQTATVQTASNFTGLRPDQITVYTTYVGGGFGRRLESDFVSEAVRISKAVGRPVKVVWSREDDMKNDFYRPACAAAIEAELDASGRITAWTHRIAAPSVWERIASDAEKKGADPFALDGVADTLYDIPNFHVEYVKVDAPVPVGFWRSAGASHNSFMMECFMDELAHAARKDPVAFRLEYLADRPRAKRVIETAAERAGWPKPRTAGNGMGIAHHFSDGSYVAQAAEVSVDQKTGAVRVHRVVCAIDCGQIVNPDTIAGQIEGGIIFGLSGALKEKVQFSNGGVSSSNFSDYRLLTMSETPEIEVHILNSDESHGGVSDTGVPPIAPAVANAVFAATGARVRTLPITPAEVHKALKRRAPGA